MRNRYAVNAKWLRGLNIVLGLAFTAFLIWDLCAHWKDMSPGQAALGIIQIVLDFAVVVCEVLALVIPACSIIPVIGQVAMVLAVVVGVLVLIFGDTQPQPTPGEEFILRVRHGKDGTPGWLSTLDAPPKPLLTYTFTPTEGPRDTDCTVEIKAENKTGKDIELIQVAENLDHGDPAPDKLASVLFTFASGTDDPCLFSNTTFCLASENMAAAARAGGAGICSLEWMGSPMCMETKLLKPNGTNARITQWDFRIVATPPTGGSEAAAAPKTMFAADQVFKMTVSGRLAKQGTSALKCTEARPGAPACVKIVTFTRK